MTAALQVVLVAHPDAVAALRLLVADTGVAISVTACDDDLGALALLDGSSCDAVVVQMTGVGNLHALETLAGHAPTAGLIVLLDVVSGDLRDLALASGAHDCLASDEQRNCSAMRCALGSPRRNASEGPRTKD